VDNPTAAALARSTRQAAGTRSAQATQAVLAAAAGTATAASQATAWAQANVTSTAEAQATLQAIAAAEHTWPLRLHDSFQDDHVGWPQGQRQVLGHVLTRGIAGGRYHWELAAVAGPGSLVEQPAQSPPLGDFYAAVSIQFGPGDDAGQLIYGLAYRLAGQDFGFFGLQKTKGYRAQEMQAGSEQNGEFQASSLINTRAGAVKRLAVLAQGQVVSLPINDQRVTHYVTPLAPGAVGLGVVALSSSPADQVDFTDFELRGLSP